VNLEDLPGHIAAGQVATAQPIAGKALKDAMSVPERAIILEVLEQNNWNRNATADQLGINRTTLYKKMRRLGLMDAPKRVQGTGLGANVGGKAPQVLS
jgi:transcriptional regulator of acetoin/glycerol metabolism